MNSVTNRASSVLKTIPFGSPATSRTGGRAVAREVKRTNARRGTVAIRELKRAAAQLERAGWQTGTVITSGEPLRDLLATVASERNCL